MIKKIRHYYGSSYITLAGELNLASESRGRLFTLTPELKQTVNQMISILQEDFPFIRHDIQEGIMETTISLFAYRSACAPGARLICPSLYCYDTLQWDYYSRRNCQGFLSAEQRRRNPIQDYCRKSRYICAAGPVFSMVAGEPDYYFTDCAGLVTI